MKALALLFCILPCTAWAGSAAWDLESAVSQALRQNPAILRAEETVRAAEGRLSQARSFSDPSLEARFGEAPSPISFGKSEEYEIGLSQPFRFPGKRRAQVRMAETELQQAQALLGLTRRLTQFMVETAYCRVRYAWERLTEVEALLDSSERLSSLTAARYRAGAASSMDALKASAETAIIQGNRLESLVLHDRLRARLNTLAGRDPSTSFEPVTPLPGKASVGSLEEVLSDALAESPSLTAAGLETRRREADLRLARLEYAPDFEISLALQTIRDEDIGEFDKNVWATGVSLTLPLWRRPSGLVQEKQAGKSIAAISLADLERRKREAVSSTYHRLVALGDQVEALEKGVLPALDDQVRLGTSRYQSGQIGLLELLDLVRTYREMRLNHLRLRLERAVAAAELRVAGEAIPELGRFDGVQGLEEERP